jgi:hypothetical protein
VDRLVLGLRQEFDSERVQMARTSPLHGCRQYSVVYDAVAFTDVMCVGNASCTPLVNSTIRVGHHPWIDAGKPLSQQYRRFRRVHLFHHGGSHLGVRNQARQIVDAG